MRNGIKREDIELLAPAGNWECLKAAVANGANAVFFGVEKFNARARAENFQMAELPEIMAFLHMYGVKGFLTFNILVFENELEDARELVEACIDAGVDALIVQDLGLVKLIREISPDFPIHGSTQMTITSPEAVEFTKPFAIERVVLGRENSLKEIKVIGEKAKLPMEVFVHGALCVSYSGQCLTSEMWGGRSANRGECAQACRLPYDLIVDGVQRDMGNIAYLLSPKDLAAIELVPELIEAGVTSFKIEGRLKSPEYVANVVSKYRAAIDRYFAGQDIPPSEQDIRELQQSFSRGFTTGFLEGTNNKKLLDGSFPKSRGVFLGTVKKVLKHAVLVELSAPLKRGDGIVFDAGDPTQKEEGGRVYDLLVRGQKVEGEVSSGLYEIVMGRNDVKLQRVHVGDRVWKTSDPELDKRLRKTFETDKPYRTFPLAVHVSGQLGQKLSVTWVDKEASNAVTSQSDLALEQALKRPLTKELLLDQLGRLGGTIYRLEESDLSVHLDGELILPVSELNRMRREAVEQLLYLRSKPPVYRKNKVDAFADVPRRQKVDQPLLTALCRSLEQVEAAAQTDVDFLYADFEFVKQYPDAVKLAHRYGKKIAIATMRIHMPDENGVLALIAKSKPDAILVRNTGALHYYMARRGELNIPLIGDFSLNIANHKAVELFLGCGLERVTPSYDLNIQQMVDLLEKADASKMEVVIHQHMPMFHTEHCVYCTFLSPGTDHTNCGTPCETSRVSLRDRVGFSHPVRVDTGCRNTVYNAIDQSGAEYLGEFRKLGVGSYRIEFLEEEPARVQEVIQLYRQALRGEVSGTHVWRSLKATNQLGVTRGQLIK
ncbi:U32 family peptidase [Brevibacillus composti]|uniref:U32 family peptidase n=1 Tax=Brevibacillus composti TaxID=2796470 RepID=A0A7T5JPG2_9BACL|nr:U32 family peptidase [Brevibacillus composti]QQE75448.1 U32 family peptidase [Brevibacillus composti]QUO42474.1 U32 family peptidase [Brevibacillus composti]